MSKSLLRGSPDTDAANSIRLSVVFSVLFVCSCSVAPSDNRLPGSEQTPVYSIEGRSVELESGLFTGDDGTISLLTSASGDLDGDAVADQAAILVHSSRGTGTFYYLNVLLTNYPGSAARVVFLGDRIRFDYVDIYGEGSVSRLTGVPIHPDDYGKLVVGYYTHSRNQAFAEIPEIYVTKHWTTDDGKLVLVEDY